jgi:putative endonuclease
MPEGANVRPFSLYIVRCADDTLYTGIAIDVEKRVAEHVSGSRGAKYLRGKGPIELVFRAEVGNRSEASRLEYRVKRLPRQEKEALILGSSSLDVLAPAQVLEEDCS